LPSHEGLAGGGGWATQQLAEFNGVVSRALDGASAIAQAVELAAAAVDAEIAAIVRGGEVISSVGFAEGRAPDSLLTSAGSSRGGVSVPGALTSRSIVVAIDESDGGQLLVARAGADDFTGEEALLLRAMARSLGLTLRLLAMVATERKLRQRSERQAKRNKHLVSELRERQRLLEWISRIERLISLRQPLQEVLQTICKGTADLLGEELVAIRTSDPLNPGYALIPGHLGISPVQLNALLRMPFSGGLSGEAMAEDRVVIRGRVGGQSADPTGMLGDLGITTLIVGPIRESGLVIGTLTVASRRRGRHFGTVDQEKLMAMAEHVSLALTDARTMAELEHKAFYDDLTGLANRALFLDRLEHSRARQRRDPAVSVAVIFLDLNRFKDINDSLGHAEGDLVLTVVGERVTATIRNVDTAARLGGDEFAVMLEDPADSLAAVAAANRILEALREPIHVGARDLHLTGSAGVALSSGAAHSGEDLIRNADLALHRAKAEGSRSSIPYVPQMHADVLRRLELESSLSRGLENEEFRAFYQPLIDFRTGLIVGVEALVRWVHPVHGVVQPADFLDVAEETGLIIPIGESVFREATRQVRDWSERIEAAARLELSVNLSGTQAQNPRLLDNVASVLAEVGLPAGRVVFEITETVLMHDRLSATEKLEGLKALGARIAIDDFGTGYSSLAYLSQFPIDVLKIDRSFVQSITDRQQDFDLIKAIVILAASLRLKSVAEGIETMQQGQMLADLGCDVGQGFYFSRPLAATELEKLLRVTHAPTEWVTKRDVLQLPA